MAIERLPPVFRGYAIFGTSAGLSVHGTGIFAGVNHDLDILEFDAGRSRDGVLRGIGKNYALFRRRMTDMSGNAFEVLGAVSPCWDLSSRAGFFGGCVAIEPDALRNRSTLYDWEPAFAAATELWRTALGAVSAEGSRFTIPDKTPLPRPKDRLNHNIALTCARSGEALFSVHDTVVADVAAQMQALAITGGAPTTTIIVLPVEGELGLFDPPRNSALAEVERRISEAQQRSQQEAKAALEATATMTPKASVTPMRPSTAPAGRPASDALQRIAALEQEVQNLWDHISERENRSAWRASPPHESQRDAMDQSKGFGSFQQEEETWLNANWVPFAGIAAALCVVIAMAWGLYAMVFSGADAPDEVVESQADVPMKEPVEGRGIGETRPIPRE